MKTKWFCPASLHNIFLYIRYPCLLKNCRLETGGNRTYRIVLALPSVKSLHLLIQFCQGLGTFQQFLGFVF